MSSASLKRLSIALAATLAMLVVWCGSAIAQAWRDFERAGDQSRLRGDHGSARDLYQRAIDLAGADAPRELWQKYNAAFQAAYVAEMRFRASLRSRERQEETRVESEQPVIPATSVDSLEAEEPTTRVGDPSRALYVADDGTIRIDVESLVGGATRIGRVDGHEPLPRDQALPAEGPSEPSRPTLSDEPPAGPRPVSLWGRPLADTTGGRTRFSPADKVPMETVVSEGSDRSQGHQSAVIETSQYEVSDLWFRFTGARRLTVTGRLTNKASHPFRNARVYVRLYNDTGVFRGRNWGYVRPGRHTLNAGQTKEFDVVFAGFGDTVGSYSIEVVTNLGR